MTMLDYVLVLLRRAAENSCSWSVSPDEATALVAEVERLRGEAAQERAAERTAVVAWLREVAEKMQDADEGAYFWIAVGLVHDIERGEHRREEAK